MQGSLQHRGPDDRGIYVASSGAAGLVHARLAILDLSASGHQPMGSGVLSRTTGRLDHRQTGQRRYWITFNGEIYNFRELREELETDGVIFESHSDTEVILKMYERYGPACVREFDGMFAFAIWDEQEESCFLARDPLGIKPLYYAACGRQLVFASELRAILSTNLVPPRLSPTALRSYFLFGSVQEPETLIDGVRCLPAGHYMVWRGGQKRLNRYWDVEFRSEPLEHGEILQTTRDSLEETVQRHFVSDVPVSVFLSGGIDSTAIVALARKIGVKELRTFCISFEEEPLNEGGVASRTAKHFATDHYDWRLRPSEGRTLLTEFLSRLDQPSIDGFNTYCVSKHARMHGAKVVLSGLGGDELFGGYPSFAKVPRMAAFGRWLGLSGPIAYAAGKVLSSRSVPRQRRLGSFLCGPPSVAAAYWAMRGIFTPPEADSLLQRYMPHAPGESDQAAMYFHVPAQPTASDQVSYLEITRYMRNQLLRDSDVMSMAWGLELRVPFADRKLIDALARIPAQRRLASGKRLLVDAVPEIPEWVASQPKRGFVFPFEAWVADEWRDVFSKLTERSPVPLGSWYRKWCLFTLEDFIKRNGIDAPVCAAG